MIRFSKRNKSLVQMSCTSQELDIIRKHFTTINPKAKYETHGKDICPVTALGNFANMLLLDIYMGVRKLFPTAEVLVDAELMSLIRPELPGCRMPRVINPQFTPRPHQIKATQAFLKFGHGIIVEPTRAGKSLILYLIIRSLFESGQKNFKTALLLVPNTQLVIQMREDMELKYQIPNTMEIVQFSSATPALPPQTKKRLIISNRQWLEKHYLELPQKIDLLVVDEVHFCRVGNWISEFVGMFETVHKLGCTGTMPDGMADVWKVKKLFGPVICEEKVKTLQDAGLLSKLEITPIKFLHRFKRHFTYNPLDGISTYSKECDFLASDEKLNAIVAKIISSVSGNVLMLFDNLEYGRNIYNLATGNKHYVDGSVAMETREAIRAKMSKNSGNILFANTACMGVGITIDMVDSIFIAGMSRSSSTSVIQAIGRGLAVYEGKKALKLIDIASDYQYSEKHQELRFLLYDKFYGVILDDLRSRTKTISI